MAETILYETVTELLKKLGSMALQEFRLVSGVRDELDKLKNTVSTIRAVLVHAEEQRATNPEVEDWLEKLYDAFYDADDLLDDFSTEVLRCQVMTQDKKLKKVRNFFSSSNQLAFSSKMGHEIKAINKRLDAIAEEKKKFHLIEQPVQNLKREESHSFVRAESVIGRDVDKTKIVELLLDSNVHDNVSVVAIVGIGGLGKTTLAQFVYNDEEVTKYFELKKWVCVSDPFDVKLIVQKVIGSEAQKDLGLDELQNLTRAKVDGKKYLLVLDDVWNEDPHNWLKLINLLKGGSRGSKILITTRTELVAKVTRANSTYILKGLSKEESSSLFNKMAFKQGEESKNPCRVTMGEEIVQKCKGVPLAIIGIGSLLYFKDTDAEWLLFKNNDLAKIAEVEDVILPILKLSYDYLPSNLKGCFAFCSLYLKDQKIDKQELIHFWIANGFIQSTYENQQLEDVGDMYFMNLLRRSLFQDVEINKWGVIISCKMHDLVHDLAQSVARPKSSIVNLNVENVTKRTRHVSFDFYVNSLWKIPTPLIRAKKLRTFTLECPYSHGMIYEKICQIVSTFKCLRVLNMSNLNIKTLPRDISKVKHLRYLDLSGNSYIKTLPSTIIKLQNLQTLKLNKCNHLEELPKGISKLVSLRHLELERCDALIGMPCGLEQLTSLSTLTKFVADFNRSESWLMGLSALQNLNNLGGSLSIEIRGGMDSRMKGTKYLEAKKYLKTLIFDFTMISGEDEELLLESLRPHPNLKELTIYYKRGVSFPSWMRVDTNGLLSSLPNLVIIDLGRCQSKRLPLFGQLPFLQILSLWHMDHVEHIDNRSSGSEESVSSSGGGAAAIARRSEPTPKFFPSLKELTLWGLPKLKGWWSREAVEEEEAKATIMDQQQQQHQQKHYCLSSFPSLSKLKIRDCPNLASMPILQPCLEQLQLRNVSKKLVQQLLMMTLVSPAPTISMTTDIATSSSSSLLPLSNLKSLTLSQIEDLDDDDDMQFLQGQNWNLIFLKISSFQKLVSLPVGLQHLTTLQTLEIKSCDNLMALPEWIGNLTLLERLKIYDCYKLTSLPDEMRCLTALQKLEITSDSDELHYTNWPKIDHIPDVYFSRRQW
ncbi:putative disease resistance protein RGA4 [Cornus florida]|uniref:putative disease resistance protein RGA4 n=1 Tax=Cornus florida TaxID=4283 RepID=UPI00289C99F8|nr:putative disease resistance protein RGA4 [Cornus florida]XP_059651890.1 putative disease resistance protein RGA4 [Cornus florida]XP_059651891.1 putative disease resistance protein RGA4 [Cornus florida]XP_059651892.1 putative disease resistance protein RGA4 [Cornus florida]XP_059651894.1 putative disease resistance protein RGA4 [Cornus florida]XP_059651895.1 putative disease resistance protein RGA4 [Cornus florida]XP_059651896.1 putative disease resistance protein RGA4 [Cornus florida]XP_0